MCACVACAPSCGIWKGPDDCCAGFPLPVVLWIHGIFDRVRGLSGPVGEGSTCWSGAACDGVLSLASAPGCMVFLGGGQKSQAWCLCQFLIFFCSFPYVLCVGWGRAGPCFRVRALVTQALFCLSGAGTREHDLFYRPMSVQSTAWHIGHV